MIQFHDVPLNFRTSDSTVSGRTLTRRSVEERGGRLFVVAGHFHRGRGDGVWLGAGGVIVKDGR